MEALFSTATRTPKVIEVREYLRFAGVVMPVNGRARAALPRPMTLIEVRFMLEVCDRNHPTGQRDYAIVLTLVGGSFSWLDSANLHGGARSPAPISPLSPFGPVRPGC